MTTFKKLRHGMAAHTLRGGVGGMSAEERDGNVRQVPVLLQRSGRALDDGLRRVVGGREEGIAATTIAECRDRS